MPHTRESAQGPCHCATQMPGTLAELQSVADVTRLGHDVEVLALLGTQLEDALITTRNRGALISGQGGYGPLQTNDMPLRLSQRRVTVRVSTKADLSLVRYDGDQTVHFPGALAAVDAQGNVCHRVQYVSRADRWVAQSLDPELTVRPPERHTQARCSTVISLAAVRRARTLWPVADTGTHLNDLLEDGGAQRRQCLPHIGGEKAWRISTDILESFLCFLHDRRKSFARMVPASGLLQADTGVIEEVGKVGDLLVVRAEKSTFSIDCNEIACAWVVATTRHWLLELYDRDQKAIAVLAADPKGDDGLWRSLLASLPRAR